MRQYFTPQELTDHFTLLPPEHALLANKSGVNRLGFVVLLKFCQWEGRFPEHWQEVPCSLVQHIAATLELPADEFNAYDLAGRTARYHKEQIREWLGFRPGTITDADTITAWACTQSRVDDATVPQLTERLTARYKALGIEPPTPPRLARLAHSALRTIEEQFFTTLMHALTPETCPRLDALLDTAPPGLSLTALKADGGPRNVEGLLTAVDTLRHLQALQLPATLLAPLSARYLRRMHLPDAHVLEEVLREGPQLLRRFDQPLQHRIGIDLEHPRRAPDAQALSQAGEDTHDKLDRLPLAMEQGPEGLEKITTADHTQQLPPGTATRMAVGAEIPPSDPAAIGTIRVGAEMRRGIHVATASPSGHDAGGWGAGCLCVGDAGVLTGVAGRLGGEARKGWGLTMALWLWGRRL